MRPPYDADDEPDVIAVVPAAREPLDDGPVDWTPSVPVGPPAPARTVGEAATIAGWRRPEPDEPEHDDRAAEQAAKRSGAQAGADQDHRPYWTETRVLRFAATIGGIVCSIGLMVTVGVALPGLPWLPFLIGTLFYGGLAVRTWAAHQAAEEQARIREENYRRSRFHSIEPVDRDGGWQ